MPFKATEKTLLEVESNEWGVTLVQGYINRDGVFKPEFCKKKNYQTKEMEDLRPLSVYVGKTPAKAVQLANYILEKFGGSEVSGKDGDIPDGW